MMGVENSAMSAEGVAIMQDFAAACLCLFAIIGAYLGGVWLLGRRWKTDVERELARRSAKAKRKRGKQ